MSAGNPGEYQQKKDMIGKPSDSTNIFNTAGQKKVFSAKDIAPPSDSQNMQKVKNDIEIYKNVGR